jgi:hypothetical protein
MAMIWVVLVTSPVWTGSGSCAASARSNEIGEREATGLDQRTHGVEVGGLPFGGDAQARLAHEGGREGEADRRGVEAAEHQLTLRCEAGDQCVEQGGVAGDVDDDLVVAARIGLGCGDLVALGAAGAQRVGLPHGGGGRSAGDRQAGDEAAEDAVADDQLRRRAAFEKVGGGRGKGEEDALLAERLGDRNGADGRDDQAAGGTAEQAVCVAVAAGAGDEDPLAHPAAGVGAGVDDTPDRFVAGDERVGEAGEWRHGAGPEQFLGPAADAAPGHVDQHVTIAHRVEREFAKRDPLGCLDDDGKCVQWLFLLRKGGLRLMPQRRLPPHVFCA